VKRLSTDDTALVTAWENRPLPGVFFRLSFFFIVCIFNFAKQYFDHKVAFVYDLSVIEEPFPLYLSGEGSL
jgi:hypothetical protein